MNQIKQNRDLESLLKNLTQTINYAGGSLLLETLLSMTAFEFLTFLAPNKIVFTITDATGGPE